MTGIGFVRVLPQDLPGPGANRSEPPTRLWASGSKAWPDPDPAFLRSARRPAPPLPDGEIFGPWHRWICDAAKSAGAPPDYVAMPLLVMTAALIGNARAVSPWPGWTEPAVLWGCNVGDPSSNKSPGADPVLAAVRFIEKKIGEGFDERHRVWQTLATSAEAACSLWEGKVTEATKKGLEPPTMPAAAVAPPEPERPRVATSDTTPERLGTLLANNPKGLVQVRDELSGWLLSFDRYSKGGERSFYIEAFGARPYTIDRVKAGGSVHIPRLSISVFGGIQPDRFRNLLLEGDDDGLPSRFMWAWPEPLPPSRPKSVASEGFIRSAFRRLSALRPGRDQSGEVPILMRLSTAAADDFQKWRGSHHDRSAATSGMIASAWGKMPGLVLRLSLVFELGVWATSPLGTPEPTEVSHKALLHAIGFVEDYLKPMTERVYGDAAVPGAERHATTLRPVDCSPRQDSDQHPGHSAPRRASRSQGQAEYRRGHQAAGRGRVAPAGWLDNRFSSPPRLRR